MDEEFKPNVSRIIFGNILGYLIVLAICIGLFVATNVFLGSFNIPDTTQGVIFDFNFIEYFVYVILVLIMVITIFLFINLIGNTLSTKYSINKKYLTRKTTFLNEIIEDIPIKQITNADYTIGWFWDKIFKTGSIKVYTSGSDGADMNIYGINSVIGIFEDIKLKVDLFRKDIIKEKEARLVKTVKPNVLIASLLTTISSIGIYVILIFQVSPFLSLISNYLGVAIFILILPLFIIAFFSAMVYKKKQYDFYTDKLEYYDGFLTFHKVTVPLERITNIDLIRTLFDKLFGVSKIKIETAGSGASEIYIKYVTGGETIVSELKEVLKENGRN